MCRERHHDAGVSSLTPALLPGEKGASCSPPERGGSWKGSMKHCASLLVVLLAAFAQNAFAQQAGVTLNEKQLLGRQILAQSCGVCHLTPSLGARTFGPPLSKASAGGNDEVMRTFILHGSDRMPGFRYYLKPAEIDAIIAYVRTVPVPPPPPTAPAPAARAATDPQRGDAQ